jgi:hypothetical protein
MVHEIREGRIQEMQKEIVKRILREGVIEHDPDRPLLFRAMFSYGSKHIEAYVHKDKKEAGAVIESVRSKERKEEETTRIYEAFHAFLRGVANRVGESIKYGLRTENEQLILWAKERGADIFQWSNILVYEDGFHEFLCEVHPTVSIQTRKRRVKDQDVQILLWELRKEFSER